MNGRKRAGEGSEMQRASNRFRRLASAAGVVGGFRKLRVRGNEPNEVSEEKSALGFEPSLCWHEPWLVRPYDSRSVSVIRQSIST